MIEMILPTLPPTINHAYENVPTLRVRGKIVGGGRRLSEKGRSFKREAKVLLSKQYGPKIATIRPDAPYLLFVRFYFKDLLNKTFPLRAKTRYKKIDATNRIKLLEDALADACGIDDSQFVAVIIVKDEAGAAGERTIIRLFDFEMEATNIHIFGD